MRVTHGKNPRSEVETNVRSNACTNDIRLGLHTQMCWCNTFIFNTFQFKLVLMASDRMWSTNALRIPFQSGTTTYRLHWNPFATLSVT